jgi:hypothetical protein
MFQFLTKLCLVVGVVCLMLLLIGCTEGQKPTPLKRSGPIAVENAKK